ncbi:serine/threonine-protein phosphatase 2A activator isoform X2 [Diabrotica virgifera virgifera]|nr:serine/threonine-protein phosphatase 2A activator isoform X2 [Diabrotica virgifera virgifera]
MGDMQHWEKSEAYHEYLGFVCALNEAIKCKTNSAGSANASEEINKICSLLNSLDTWIDEIPPIQQPQRFGNQAFKQWFAKVKDGAAELLHSIFPENLHKTIPEVSVYLIEGFGNATRIDYGTGHELSFLMFLCALFKIGYLKTGDGPAVAGKVFVRYLEVVRKLQTTYNMEPAGSHGVWSLDDYQFVPFIWGSSQFIGNGHFEPTCFLKDNIVSKHSSEYMFLSCIEYINRVKTGPFAEHSNQLWSISGVSTWTKINTGLIKMYKAEVLGKFPLVQHIYFGSIFTLNLFKPPAVVRPRTSFQAPQMPPTCQSTISMSAKTSLDSVSQSSSSDISQVITSSRDLSNTGSVRSPVSENITLASFADSTGNGTSDSDRRRSSVGFATNSADEIKVDEIQRNDST